MGRFVQALPVPADPYQGDRLLRSWLERHLGKEGHAAARPRLEALAADVTGPLLEAHRDAEAHPPQLVRYDPWGKRINHVETSAGWETLRQAAARHALVAEPYRAGGSRVLQHALLHLYGPESAVFSCPVAMSDGAAALLSGLAGEPSPWLEKLTSTDPAVAVTSGQWMTESQGGSDLSGTGTMARRAGDEWLVTGEKWFCSAIDSAIAIALARPAGADTGTRTLAPFLIPRDQPGVTIHRLKDKLGTRALPTAEVGLEDAVAIPLGDPAQGGLARMMTLVVVTRLHNAAAASSGMRRGLDYALAFASARQVAGGRLDRSPLHRATLATLAVDTAGAFVLTGHAFSLMDSGADELRIVAPLAKLATGKLAVANASEYVECFGGAGYVEDTGIPRLLRDAQVLPIWEGTTNVLALDVVRAVVAGHAEPLLSRVDTHPSLEQVAKSLREEVATVRKDPTAPAVLAGARGLALRLAHALTAALLLEHSAWGTEIAAELWARRWLSRDDIAADAAHHYSELCG